MLSPPRTPGRSGFFGVGIAIGIGIDSDCDPDSDPKRSSMGRQRVFMGCLTVPTFPRRRERDQDMSRSRKLTHSIWRCQCRVAWVPRHRDRVLRDVVEDDAGATLLTLADRVGVEVVELSVMPDHVHLVALVRPTLAVQKAMGERKGRAAIRVFQEHGDL